VGALRDVEESVEFYIVWKSFMYCKVPRVRGEEGLSGKFVAWNDRGDQLQENSSN
jgi:hypothetical protein